MPQFLILFRKNRAIIMSVLTKEDLRSLLSASIQENERLRTENERLLIIVADATQRIEKANDTAEEYQRMFGELFKIIKTEYDSEFTVEYIPKLLS